MRKPPSPPGLEESAEPLAPEILSAEQLAELNASVLDAYGFTCAATQKRFSATGATSANLVVVPIRPVETGGRLLADNLVPLIPQVAQAFRDGDFTIGVDLEIIVDLKQIESDVLGSFHHSGQFFLPNDRAFWPHLDNLHYHRHLIFQAIGA